MQLSKILEQKDDQIKFRRRSWDISFYLRATKEGKIFIRNTGDAAHGIMAGLSVQDILADDWELLEPTETRVQHGIYVNSTGYNFIFLDGTLYKLTSINSLAVNSHGELYKIN